MQTSFHFDVFFDRCFKNVPFTTSCNEIICFSRIFCQIELEFQPTYGGIRQELGRLQFPPGESPRVSRMYIYTGNCLADCTAPPLPVPRYPSVYHDGVQILRRNQQTRGLRIRLSTFPDLRTSESGISVRDVYFGDSAQDVISAVGAPARTFYKSEDKMKIHSPNAFRKAATHKSDYFYNYFTLGFVSALRVYFDRKCC